MNQKVNAIWGLRGQAPLETDEGAWIGEEGPLAPGTGI